jgi:hypothetical protein
MKEFITGVESTPQKETGSREMAPNQPSHSDPEVIRELTEKLAAAGQERLDTMAPVETPKQEQTKSFLVGLGEKLKGFMRGKELSPQDQLQQDIHALTHFTSSNAGMGGLGNFSSGGFKGLSAIAERYAIAPETITSITTLQKEIEDMDNGPEKVEAMKNLRDQKMAVMQHMRNAVEGK